jgi:hypothetical protein
VGVGVAGGCDMMDEMILILHDLSV